VHSGGGGHLLLLLSSSGGGWSFGMVAVWCGGHLAWWLFGVVAGCHGLLPLLHSDGGGHRWVGWSLIDVVLGVLPWAPGCGLIAIFMQQCW